MAKLLLALILTAALGRSSSVVGGDSHPGTASLESIKPGSDFEIAEQPKPKAPNPTSADAVKSPSPNAGAVNRTANPEDSEDPMRPVGILALTSAACLIMLVVLLGTMRLQKRRARRLT